MQIKLLQAIKLKGTQYALNQVIDVDIPTAELLVDVGAATYDTGAKSARSRDDNDFEIAVKLMSDVRFGGRSYEAGDFVMCGAERALSLEDRGLGRIVGASDADRDRIRRRLSPTGDRRPAEVRRNNVSMTECFALGISPYHRSE